MTERDSSKRGDNEASSASGREVEQGEQGPQVQRQPEGMDRLVNLMTQYFEQQIAREERHAKLHERDVQERSERREQHKKGKFDTRPETIMDQSQARVKFKSGSAKTSRSRSARKSKGVICYRCRVEGHMVRDCPKPYSDGCYQCGQPGHIARLCSQRPSATTSSGSSIAGDTRGGAAGSMTGRGPTTTPATLQEPRTQAQVTGM